MVNFKGVQVGDKVRLTYEVSVRSVALGDDHFYIETLSGCYNTEDLVGVEIVRDLPAEPGSIVRYDPSDNYPFGEVFILNDGLQWQSTWLEYGGGEVGAAVTKNASEMLPNWILVLDRGNND